MKLIIDIPEEKYLHAKNLVNSGKENNPVVLAIGNGIPIPDNATKGEVIKAIFPNGTTAKFATFMRFIDDDGDHYFNCSEDWWNAPYQKGGKE